MKTGKINLTQKYLILAAILVISLCCACRFVFYSFPFVKKNIPFEAIGTINTVIFQKNIYFNEDKSTQEKMIYCHVFLKKKTDYIIELNVSVQNDGYNSSSIYADLYCPNPPYGKPQQIFNIIANPKTINLKILKVINSLDIPENAMLRIFHYSPSKITISDMKLSELTTAGIMIKLLLNCLIICCSFFLVFCLYAKYCTSTAKSLSAKDIYFRCKSWIKQSSTPLLIISYFIFVAARFFILNLIQHPLIPSDELVYKNMALSFYQTGSFYNTQSTGGYVDLPNVLYSLLISSGFLFGSNFYIAMKLINSFLINASIFPFFYLAKEIMTIKKALLITAMIMFLPCFNYINFISVDGLNLPLYYFCLFFTWKAISYKKIKYGVFSGIFLTLLFFNKPGSIGFLCGILLTGVMLLTLFLVKRQREESKRLLQSLIVIGMAFLTSFISVSLLLKGDISYSLGIYNTVSSVAGIPRATFIEIISMLFANFSTILYIYLIPIFVAIATIIQYLKEKDKENNFQRLSLMFLGVFLFFTYVVFTAKFMITIYNLEHFSRLHARYYFMTCPFFIITFAAYAEKLNWDIKNKIIISLFFTIVSISNIYYFFPQYINLGLTIFDNIDFAWYILVDNKYITSAIISLILSGFILYYLFQKKITPQPYFIFIFGFILYANFAEIKLLTLYDSYDAHKTNQQIDFINSNIPEKNAAVVLIGSDISERLRTVFWLSYNYKAIYDLPTGALINKDRIPVGSQYIILLDKYICGFPVDKIKSNNKITILKNTIIELLPPIII